MLFSKPPGYHAGTTNQQTLGGLATPGWQSNAVTPGLLNKNSNSVPSNYSWPSSQAAPVANMNQYLNSGNGNFSTLLRALIGNKR
jgi:hypothetical protein